MQQNYSRLMLQQHWLRKNGLCCDLLHIDHTTAQQAELEFYIFVKYSLPLNVLMNTNAKPQIMIILFREEDIFFVWMFCFYLFVYGEICFVMSMLQLLKQNERKMKENYFMHTFSTWIWSQASYQTNIVLKESKLAACQ